MSIPVGPDQPAVTIDGLLDADRLARLAAHGAGATAASVCVVDTRSATIIGDFRLRDLIGGHRTVPRDQMICTLVAETGQPVVIDDVRTDARTGHRRGVARQVGAYAGYPVRHGDGAVAVVCALYDRRPRRWRAEQLIALDDATQLLAGELAARRGGPRVEHLHRADDLDRQLARSRSDFVGLIGHELRTPLTSITAYLDLVVESTDTTPFGEVRELLQVVQRHTENLCAIINDLIDLEALEAGDGDRIRHPVDLAALVETELARVAPAAQAHGVHLAGSLAPCLVRGNPERLRQVVGNVVGNAIDYSPDGGDVDVTLTAAAGIAELVVADHGLGIPERERPRLFQRFHRGVEARDRRIPGTGLGLTISRTVVHRHGGTIGVAPNTPHGTVVTVRLPCS